MRALIFYLSIPLIYFFSVLPFPILYGVSDLFFVLTYYVIGYRKKVVTENLERSFPEKSEAELKQIRRRFYRYLMDVTFETLKLFTMSSKELAKRLRINPQAKKIFMEYYDRGQNYCVVLGHYGNWEWANSGFSIDNPAPMYGVYHELSNPYFDKLVIHMRSRYGTHVMEMKETVRVMMAHRNELMVGGFIADQTPPPEGAYWTTFLNQDTPVFRGVEKIARKLNYPVVFVTVRRLRRGYYELLAEKITDEPQKTAEGMITELHTRALEREILSEPAYWLWSHRRWKHKRPAGQVTTS